MDFAFHVFNALSDTGITMALHRLMGDTDTPPVVVCIGSDLAIGDSLGPITGTLIRREYPNFHGYLYGTLRAPVTAKEVKYLTSFLRQTHPSSKIIAIDAAVGEDSEIGLIKVSDCALRPGAGANKRLGKVGDISILGIVARKSAFSYSQLNLTRLNNIYMMADTLSRAIGTFFEDIKLYNAC